MTKETEARMLREVEALRADVAAIRAELEVLRLEVSKTRQLLVQYRERLLQRHPEDVAVIEAAFGPVKSWVH